MSDPLEPRRLHPLSPVLDGARLLPQAVVLLVVSGVGGGPAMPLWIVGALVLLGLRYLAWARTTYRIEDGALVHESGLLNRTRTVLPLDRVQQVDLQRKLRHQVTGLVVVRIDRAGGGPRAEVVLDAVTAGEAARLQAELGAAGARARVATAAAPDGAPGAMAADPAPDDEPERVLLRVTLDDVALAGVTGVRLLVVLATVGGLYGLLDDVGREEAVFDAVRRWVEGGGSPTSAAVLVAALVVVPVWLAAAAGSSILADGGFTLTRRGDRLRVSRGVLDQREASLALDRIQAVRIHDNPVRRALGRVTVSLQSAGGSGTVDGASTTVTVPLLRRTELDALLAEVLPRPTTLPPLTPAPPAARRRARFRHVVPAVVVAVPVAVLLAPGGLAALVVPVLAAGLGEASYRGLGWAETDGYVVARTGALARHTALVPVAKTQSTRLRSSPFQRRAGLATLAIDVAGRGRTPEIVDGRSDVLARLRGDALATTAARRDEAAVRRRARA